jgi:AAA domain
MIAKSDAKSDNPVRILCLRIRGFRSYGTEAREIDLDAPLAVVKGDNSQGKTATAEALEFLFTGFSSRRDLFGGAKAEYDRMLANVHLPDNDADVWVEADIRCADGVVRTVRRVLTADYSPTSDCASELTIDGQRATDLDDLGIPFGDPPLAAPVLLQHNLRYVLSTEPNRRAAYFRAVLDLTDLDIVRKAATRAKERVASLPPLPRVTTLSTLGLVAQGNTAALAPITKAANADDSQTLTRSLVAAANALNPTVTSASADDTIAALRTVIARAQEQVFPIAALAPDVGRLPTGVDPEALAKSVASYIERLETVDAEVARLTPIFTAVLNHQHFAQLTEPTPCPVCDDGTLGPDRITHIREQLEASSGLQEAARSVIEQLNSAIAVVDRVGTDLRSALPQAQQWQDQQWVEVSAQRDSLTAGRREDASALDSSDSARGFVVRAEVGMRRLRETRTKIKGLVDAAVAKVEERAVIQDDIAPLLGQVNNDVVVVATEMHGLKNLVDELHEELGEQLQTVVLPAGTREVLDLLEHRDDLMHEQRVQAQRKKVKQRVDAVGRAIQKAEAALLDDRFEKMGTEIGRWWATLRPDELVRFGGVDRRASGRRFVNLTAKLAVSAEAPPQVRDAVGVFSDSQLNALGLSAFLARQQLLGSPFVILDDPLPGYDPDHQVTFAANTVGTLLDNGVQVILLTHDPKVDAEVVGRHQHREPLHYRVELPPGLEGSQITNQDDFVGRKLGEAKAHLTNTTVEGRKAATGALRDAAERLGKQIVAAARTANGTPTTVASLGGSMLGDLIPEVTAHTQYADEAGKWQSIKGILNPGAHDDEVASTQSLGVAVGDLRKIRQNHEKAWGGLPM